MTLQDVQLRVAAIKAAAGDAERAHGLADDLYRDVLTAIAAGAADAPVLAAEALRTEWLDFDRWCA